MNILVFSWRDPKHPLAGGAEQVVMEHMKGWVQAGHKVFHFSSYFNGAKQNENFDGIEFIRKGHQHLGVQIAGFFWYLFSKHPRFDLVVDEFHGIPFFTPLYVRTKKLAVLQEVAREVWLKNDLIFPLNIIIGLIGYIFEPLVYLFYRGTVFMVGSSSAKNQLIKVGIPTKNIRVINHGVILEIPKRLPAKESTRVVVHLGALAKDKGIEDSIKTFLLLNNLGKFNFWIIGRGGEKYVTYLKNMCKSLGVGKKVKFWGFVSQKDKFKLLARSFVMINPSLLEGWGLVNIEANSVGIPVVAYNSQGLVDSVKDGVSGVICKENTPEALATEVSRLDMDKEFYSKLRRGAIDWSKQFSWEKSRKESLKLISSLQ